MLGFAFPSHFVWYSYLAVTFLNLLNFKLCFRMGKKVLISWDLTHNHLSGEKKEKKRSKYPVSRSSLTVNILMLEVRGKQMTEIQHQLKKHTLHPRFREERTWMHNTLLIYTYWLVTISALTCEWTGTNLAKAALKHGSIVPWRNSLSCCCFVPLYMLSVRLKVHSLPERCCWPCPAAALQVHVPLRPQSDGHH